MWKLSGRSSPGVGDENHELQIHQRRPEILPPGRAYKTHESHPASNQEHLDATPGHTHQFNHTNPQNTAVPGGVSNGLVEDQVVDVRNTTDGTIRTNSGRSSDSSGVQAEHRWREDDLPMPVPKLTVLDVAALVLNKQIGTGIFTTPGQVLLYTHSKSLSVGLWALGGFWTLIFLLIYLEFGDAFPFNGGELVYLDEIYRRPELLATILFSGFFIMLVNSYGNSIQFAKHVLLAAFPDLEDSTKLDPRLIRFIAVSIITLVCLIHWHSSRAGLFLNKFVAWYKIALLLVVIIFGLARSTGEKSQWSDSGQRDSTQDGMAGMVSIFYAYQGWENANYVAGEIRSAAKETSKSTLNIGATLGVMTTWILYVLVAVAIYRVLGYEDLTGPNADLAVVLKFSPRVFGTSTPLKICLAISAFGNILAVTYTASKVKQSIAIQRILPFWRQLQSDEMTPKGAIVLHWITSVIFIACAPSSSDGYSLAVGFYTYGHIMISVLVAIGLFKLKKRIRSSPNRAHSNWNYTFFRSKPLLYIVPTIFAIGNVVVLVFAGKAHRPGKLPRWYWPIVAFAVFAASGLYWSGIRILMIKIGRNISPSLREQKTIGDALGISIRVEYENNDDLLVGGDRAEDETRAKDETLAARLDGSNRRVIVRTHGIWAVIGNFLDDVKKLLDRYVF